MAEQFNAEWAHDIITDGVDKAQGIMDDPVQLGSLLQALQDKLEGVPDTLEPAFSNVPLMASMVKSYATKEYTEVPPNTIASLISAFIYLVKEKDLIPDEVPVMGLADDVAVAAIAMEANAAELKAYALWREQNDIHGSGVELDESPIEVEPELASSDL